MVQSGDKVGDILGHVHLIEPRTILQPFGAIGQVRAKHAVDIAVLIGFVKALQAIGEDAVGGIGEDPLGVAGLQIVGDIQHGLAGGDDVVRDEHILASHIGTQILMSHNGIAAVHHTGVIPALVEHTQFHSQHGGVIHVAVEGALIGGNHHEVLPLGGDVRERPEHGLEHLIRGHQVVKAHQGHCIGHPRIVGVKGDHVFHAHALQLLQGEGAVQGLTIASSVLPSAVKQGHHHGDAVGLAHSRLNQPLQVLIVVIGGHVILFAKVLVGAAVVAHIHHKVQVIASHRALQDALAVAGGEPGTAASNAESVNVHSRLFRPAHQVRLNLVGKFFGALQGHYAQGGNAVLRAEKVLSRLFHSIRPFLSFPSGGLTGAVFSGAGQPRRLLIKS